MPQAGANLRIFVIILVIVRVGIGIIVAATRADQVATHHEKGQTSDNLFKRIELI